MADMEFKDYYATLGVSRSATDDELKRAFRSLARKYHPDVAKDKKTAEEKFKQINEAYEVLGNPENRRKYDELGAAWKHGGGFRPPPGARPGARRGRGQTRSREYEFQFGGTGFSDFFEQFFGRGARSGGDEDVVPGGGSKGGGPFSGFRSAQRGSDIEGDISVTLHESLRGSVRSVTLSKTDARTGENQTETYRVRIPPGVREGQLIRVAGKGEDGQGGAAPGDLYLRVRLAAHPEFTVRGSDLEHDLELTPWEAVLGAEVSVPTLDGRVTVRIPAGTATGQALRVRGQGLPKGHGDERGDLYVTASVQVPSEVTPAEKELWEQLARTSAFKPRKEHHP